MRGAVRGAMRVGGAAVALLAAAGCDALFGVEPGADAAGRDGAAVVDAVVVDAGIDAMDDDRDGVDDTVDNCPGEPNTDQHDEDADQRGDACDLCPHVYVDGLDFDSDGDGVGSVCDPDDDIPHRWEVFTPFTPAFLPVSCSGSPANEGWACYDAAAGTLMADDDALRVDAGRNVQLRRGGGPSTSARVMGLFRAPVVPTTTSHLRLAQHFSTNGDLVPEGYVMCSVDWEPTGYQGKLEVHFYSGAATSTSLPTLSAWTAVEMVLDVDANGARCSLGGSTAQLTAASGMMVGPAMAWVRGVEASLAYFGVVVRP